MSDERRYYPRVTTQLNVAVINCNGESIEANITDLSVNGMTLEADAIVAKHIEVIDPVSGEPCFPVEVSIEFSPPPNSSLSSMNIPCRMVHKRRLSQNTYNIGLVVLAINKKQRELLTRYVAVTGKP